MTYDSGMNGGGGKWRLAWPEPLGETLTRQLFEVKLLAFNMLSENRQRGFSGGEADFWGFGDF